MTRFIVIPKDFRYIRNHPIQASRIFDKMRRSIFLPLLIKSVVAVRMVSNKTIGDTFSSEPSCIGISTYSFAPSETVFVTVDGGYTYAELSNETSPTAVYYTPPPPCQSVIIETRTPSPILSVITISANTTTTTTTESSESITTMTTSTLTTTCKPKSSISSSVKITSNGPYLNTSRTTTASSLEEDCSTTMVAFVTVITEVSTTTRAGGHPHPNVPTGDSQSQSPPQESRVSATNAPIVLSTVTVSSAANPWVRVTVTVTKKTPVLQSTATDDGSGGGGGISLGPTFPQNNQPITIKSTSPQPQTSSLPSGNNPGSNPTNSDAVKSSPNLNGGQTTGSAVTTGNSNANGNNNGGNGNNNSPATTVTGGSGLGSIINSAFNSPFTAVVGVTTSLGAASATVTLVGGVPVQVGASSVYIGGSNVALPTGSSSAIVTVAGQTFIVLPTAIVAGTSTLGLVRSESVSYTAVQAITAAASTITRSGVIVTIQPTAAVVSGTTYTIGLNAPSTTAVVNGQTLTFNGNGVIFGSSTYAPALITAPAYVVTTIGALTISIDQSQAIISGTTYAIGSGSSNQKTTAVVDGTTVVFGPSGIVLPSTTIAPTSVQLTDSPKTSASAATRVVSDASGTLSSGTGAIARPPSFLSNIFCFTVAALAFATLPLSLIL